MKHSSWVILVTLLAGASALSQNASAVTDAEISQNVQYSHYRGPCPKEVIALLPLTLTFDDAIKTGLWLTAVPTEGASLSEPLQLGKEGLEDERAFMSLGVTNLNVGNASYPLSQLWLEKKKDAPLHPWSSAFYIDKLKTCLIMHDLKAADNPLAKSCF